MPRPGHPCASSRLNEEIKRNSYQSRSMSKEEREIVVNEAEEILDVKDVIASILLVEDLRIQKN